VASAEVTRLPASFKVAKSALDLGCGTSQPARHGKNLFGQKNDVDV